MIKTISVDYNLSENIIIKIKGEEIVSESNEIQEIKIVDTKEFGKVLLIGEKDGLNVQFSEKDEAFYHEAIVHPAMSLCTDPKKVLIIGGGDGVVAREVLKYQIEKLIMVEIDNKVIELCKKYLPIHQGAFDDSRMEIIIADGKKFIEQNKDKEDGDKYDLIILDLTDPSGPSKMLFTKEFYQDVKKNLNENGVLSIQTSSTFFDAVVLGRVYAALKEVFTNVIPYSNIIPSFFVEESYCLATDGKIKPIALVIEERKVKLNVYTPQLLDSLINYRSISINKILEKKWKPSTAADPVECYKEETLIW